MVDILEDDRQRDASVHQRYERHWLGGFKIPFQVVYKWNKVCFELNLKIIIKTLTPDLSKCYVMTTQRSTALSR